MILSGVRPPYEITDKTHRVIGRVERLLGRYEGLHSPRPVARLRRSSRIRTLCDTLAIEGNTLTEEQATTILEGKRVIAPSQDILELRNANAVYDALPDLNPFLLKDVLSGHRVMMKGLIPSAGRWRKSGVGIARGNEIAHVAPPADRVNGLMKDLFAYARRSTDAILVTSAVVHYELEFIHPFEDGNGRMGRLWHTLLLYRYHSVFEFVPLESLVREHQQRYYEVLSACDRMGTSTAFIEFAVMLVEEALRRFLSNLKGEPSTPAHRLELAAGSLRARQFSRKDYQELYPNLSPATASRDLRAGVESGLLRKTGERALTRYRFT